jgi:hypothetical protein
LSGDNALVARSSIERERDAWREGGS